MTKHYFHQSENSVNDSSRGEFSDHIAKKGREYRTETYDDTESLYNLSVQKWEAKPLPNEDPEKDRNFLFASRSVQASYDGNEGYRATASESDYDDWGNVIASRDLGEVTLDDNAGNFTDILEDRINQTIQYAQNTDKYLYGFSSQSETTDFHENVIGRETRYYDQLPFGEVSFGNLTQKDQLLNASGELLTTKIEYDEHRIAHQIYQSAGIHVDRDVGLASVFPT
ncbi:hypothetical protein HC823_01510 [Candidatus Gracilibacteria bacterium]|nr:hypothetical protein [Candidatus Gracilibacteria bacterium]